MADFHQTGVITTLHTLGRQDLARIEADLVSYSDERPIALVLPCLYSELHGPALKGIVDTLRAVPYLSQVVVSLSGPAAEHQFQNMSEFFREIRCLDGGSPTVIWNQGPRVQQLLDRLRLEGLHPSSRSRPASSPRSATSAATSNP